MRSCGIGEQYITGSSWHDKFILYAKTVAVSAGNPLYYWSHAKLKQYFGITVIGGFVERGEFADDENVIALVKNICYCNCKALIGGTKL